MKSFKAYLNEAPNYPTKRPDGAPIVDHPKVGSPAHKRGIKVHDTVSYNYHDLNLNAFSGRGKVIGHVHNREPKSQDVAIHDMRRNSVVFVDSKNVRKVVKK